MARLRGHLGDAATHDAGADDADQRLGIARHPPLIRYCFTHIQSFNLFSESRPPAAWP
jgi:hypothetical protein